MKPSIFYRSIWLLLIFSCTIIEDTDLITPADFEKIKLRQIDIEQDAGNVKSVANIKLEWDSAANTPVPGGTVTRRTLWTLTNFKGRKLKFRSGTYTNLQVYIAFFSGDRPYTLILYNNDVVVELYRFRYNDEGQLARVVFFLDPEQLVTRDTILYESGKIASIERVENTPTPGGNITVNDYINGPPEMVNSFRNSVYQFTSPGQGNCPNNTPRDVCFSFYRMPILGGGQSEQVNFYNETSLGVFNSFKLQEQRFNMPSSNREPDTYYFHPLMILKTYFENGDDLVVLYMVDWYAPGAPQNGNSSSSFDEYVKFNFVYGV